MAALALLVAGGRGERLGETEAKAFVSLAGKPMIEWSVLALRAAPSVSRIVVALPPGHHAPAGTVGTAGGATRSHSVAAALAVGGPAERVLVHDAARPLVSPELIERTLAALDGVGVDAAIAATPVTDTIKRADGDGRVRETLERAELWSVQTPQAFRREALERALTTEPAVLAFATDDAWLIERAGGTVHVVSAPRENLKVTTPVDLRLAELLLTGASGHAH